MKNSISIIFFVTLTAILFAINPAGRFKVLNFGFKITNDVLNWLHGADPANNWALLNNFGPVDEENFFTNLPITFGEIPTDLEGIYIRNGPNPQQAETGHYHWFDGDGMLHAVRIKHGKLNYTNKFIDTIRLQDERHLKRNAYPRIGGMRGIIGLIKMLLYSAQKYLGILQATDLKSGTANTALLFYQKSLLALGEANLPFKVNIAQDGKLISRGFTDFSGNWNHSFTAHPKIDPKSGNLLFFGYSLFTPPYIHYGLADKSGKFLRNFPINLRNPVMMHDFAVTQNYAIIMDLPLIFSKEKIFSGESLFVFNQTQKSKFGIFPHSAQSESEIIWFSAENCYIFHTVNAWEVGDEVILVASRFVGDFSLDLNGKNITRDIWEFRFNLKTGETTEKLIIPRDWDFGQVNPNFLGRKSKFAYFATIIEKAKFDGISKIDLENSEILSEIKYGEGKFGGEAVFVPTKKNLGKEDEGFLMAFVSDEIINKSEFWIIDAVTMRIKAVVDIPARIPYGFHGTFISEEELVTQYLST